MQSFYDVIIVGARVAGAATALLLARQGRRVLVVERGQYGTDTLSTHALMRGAVLELHRWGLLDSVKAAGVPVARTTSFHYADEEIEIPIKARDGVDGLYAPRRYFLDARLEDAAREAGAEILHGARVTDLRRAADGRIAGVVIERHGSDPVEVAGALVVGADGYHSTVARLVGAETYEVGRHFGAVVYAYWSGLPVSGYHWHFRPGVSAGVIPTNDGQVCVFAAMPPARFMGEIRRDLEAGYHRVLAETSPELAGRLAEARRESPLRGFPGQPGHIRQSWGPGWVLVGDAGYFKDPITAHGITDALRDAELLSRALARGSDAALAEYQATRDELSLGLFRLTDAIASFEWDLDSVKELHLDLSREMGKEVLALSALEPTPAAA